jgi:hypothetical protein
MLNESLDPLGYRIRKYRKAANKRRIMKKWRRRFGKTLAEIIKARSKLHIANVDSWNGGIISLSTGGQDE